jgi:hypothetical protein
MSELHKSTIDRLIAESKPKEVKDNYLFSEEKVKSTGIPIADIREMLNEIVSQEKTFTSAETTVIQGMNSEMPGAQEQQPIIDVESSLVESSLVESSLVESAPIAQNAPKSESFSLGGIEAFLDWLNLNGEKFTEMQLSAFSALGSARTVIYHGCACQEARRRNRANDYFKFFLEANKDTDLLEAIKKAANTNLLILSNHLGEITRL